MILGNSYVTVEQRGRGAGAGQRFHGRRPTHAGIGSDTKVLHTERTNGERGSDHWLYEPETGALPIRSRPVVERGLCGCVFSGRQAVAGFPGADLIVFDIASGRTTRLTKDGDPGTVDNGSARWSPDGQWISYVQYDYSAVPKRAVLVPGDPTYRAFQEKRYERIGGPISRCALAWWACQAAPRSGSNCPTSRGHFMLNQVSWAGNSDDL